MGFSQLILNNPKFFAGWEGFGNFFLILDFNDRYNGDKLPINETGFIFFENKLLGVPRIRQVKVRNDSCLGFNFIEKSNYSLYSSNNNK